MCIVQLCSGRDLPGASFTRTSVARPSTTTPSLRAILPKIIKEKTQSGAIRKESLSFSLEGILFTDLLQVKAAYCTSCHFFPDKKWTSMEGVMTGISRPLSFKIRVNKELLLMEINGNF